MSQTNADIRRAIETLEAILEARKRRRKATLQAWKYFVQDETARNGGKKPKWLDKRKRSH
jgi:hypothetical protein